MKPRDRLVVCVLAAAAALAVIWLGVVSPKRQHAAQLGTQLSAAQARLGTAQSQLAAAKAAEVGYPANLSVVKALYKAVPADDGVPRLLVSLDRTSHYKRVDFKVITVATAATAAGAAAATGPAGAASTVPGGLTPISFTFTFNGGYIDLQHFLRSVASYTLLQGHHVVAHDRLLTIQSVGLTPGQGATGAAGSQTSGTTAAVTAIAYSQPPASTLAAPAATTAGVSATTPSAPATTSTNTTR